MLETIYVGMSGLEGYSKGLNVISNNVANLNTPGFKGAQLQFSDLFYKSQNAGGDGRGAQQQVGEGLDTGATHLNFKQGEARQTGNDLDLLIDGVGFFVLRKDDKVLYTRAGQFQFDDAGYLVDRTNQARVAALGAGQQLVDVSINGLRTNPPKATSTISFADNLSISDNQHVVGNVTVYDSLGGTHTLKVTFDNNFTNVAGSWNVTVADSSGTVATGEIRFQDGKPLAGFDTIAFSYAPQNTPALSIALDFKTDATSYAGGTDSTLKVKSQDGYAAGSLTKTTFDADGYFVTNYSNGQTVKHDRLALAWFDYADGLQAEGGNVFSNVYNQPTHLGYPNEAEYGKISAGSVEMSNVDLSQQFSDLIITQRGYQASSQVITTANEMIQQLYDMRGKR